MISRVEIENSKLDEAVNTEDVDVDSEVETTVFVVGLGVDNFETAICVGDWEESVLEVVIVCVDFLIGISEDTWSIEEVPKNVACWVNSYMV